VVNRGTTVTVGVAADEGGEEEEPVVNRGTTVTVGVAADEDGEGEEPVVAEEVVVAEEEVVVGVELVGEAVVVAAVVVARVEDAWDGEVTEEAGMAREAELAAEMREAMYEDKDAVVAAARVGRVVDPVVAAEVQVGAVVPALADEGAGTEVAVVAVLAVALTIIMMITTTTMKQAETEEKEVGPEEMAGLEVPKAEAGVDITVGMVAKGADVADAAYGAVGASAFARGFGALTPRPANR
jgi:hypothetical protein